MPVAWYMTCIYERSKWWRETEFLAHHISLWS